jgi:hypothetical protein
MHAGQPATRHDLRPSDVLQVYDAQNVVDEPVEMRGDVGVAPTRPPQPVDAESGHLEECDLPHPRRARDMVDTQARAELLAVGDAIDERVLEIATHVVVRLHRNDIRPIGEQDQIISDLQMMRASVGSRGVETDGLQLVWIRGVENRHTIAEHVTDIDMATVDHDLYAIRATALIAVRQIPDAAPDALRRDRQVRIGARCVRHVRLERADP